MTTTVSALLREHLPPAEFATHLSAPSLSVKPWTNAIPAIPDFNVRQSTWEGVHRYLGPGLDLAQYNANYECQSAPSRLNERKERLNTVVETIVMEAEVQRDFDRNLGFPLRLAFDQWPSLKERSQAGPPGHTDSPETVDAFYSFSGATCIAGELKRPGIIVEAEWTRQRPMSSVSRKLAKEIRGYAYKYKCPQFFVFDGLNLLLVQFQASDREAIKSLDVQVDVWVIPRLAQDVITCTARYALYWMAWRGLMRVVGQKAVPVETNGSRRHFQYFSGRPYWSIPGQGTTFSHPDGRTREWNADEGYFYWSRRDGATGQVHTVADTLTLW